MALDALDQAQRVQLLDKRPCTTATLRLDVDDSLENAHLQAETAAACGDAAAIADFVRLAQRHEQARTEEDVLARRLRIGLLDESLAQRLRPAVALLLQ
jgi:glycerol-3-phosphate dehydrogenase